MLRNIRISGLIHSLPAIGLLISAACERPAELSNGRVESDASALQPSFANGVQVVTTSLDVVCGACAIETGSPILLRGAFEVGSLEREPTTVRRAPDGRLLCRVVTVACGRSFARG